MKFNEANCKCMLLTNKKNTVFPTITLNDHPLEVVHQINYLCITLSQNLCWSPHIQTICKKARRIIGILYRQFCSTGTHSSSVLKLYIALARPHLEYTAQVWNPHLAKDILSLERVQKFGLRICLRNYQTSYEIFKIPSLKNSLSLCTLYLIKNHLVYFPSASFLPSPMNHTSSRIYNPFGYYLPHAHCNALKCSFLHTVISV